MDHVRVVAEGYSGGGFEVVDVDVFVDFYDVFSCDGRREERAEERSPRRGGRGWVSITLLLLSLLAARR